MEKKVCQGIYVWSFTGLVGAFLDLAIAYFLLCASAMAFFSAKFLGFFGLSLPCPCSGFLGTCPNSSNYCMQRLLVDGPAEKTSAVQFSVKTKFPFNEPLSDSRLNRDANSKISNGVLELEGEASCSSVSDARKPQNVARRDLNGSGAVGRFDLKGKGVMNQRPRSGGIRRRRKGGGDSGKFSSVSSFDPPCEEAQSVPESPSSINKGGNDLVEDSMIPVENLLNPYHFDYDCRAPMALELGNRDSFGYENEFIEELSTTENLTCHAHGEEGFNTDDKNSVRFLQKALEEERAARAAVYLELEKERNAAATAADEAMAMIMRLQEEKASVEIQARQYQRILEEKSAYDAEEMDILKEILIRREREKHFLEKEVEEYRQMIRLEKAQLVGESEEVMDAQEHSNSALEPIHHPVNLPIDAEVMSSKDLSADGTISFVGKEPEIPLQNQNSILREPLGSSRSPPPVPPFVNDGDQEPQEKKMVCTDTSRELCSSKDQNTRGETIEQNDDILIQGMKESRLGSHVAAEIHIPSGGESLKQHEKDQWQETADSCDLDSENEMHILDVHVIGDKASFSADANRAKSAEPVISNENVHNKNDISSGTLLPGRSNSMSALDNERLEIDNEVRRLRERLRIVQEGRGKLNLSAEHREREKLQFKLLEDIAHQLRELRKLTEPGNAVRQASLPPPSSKALSKKRRCRSVSVGVHRSSPDLKDDA